MLTFIPGPHGEKVNKNEENFLRECLTPGSSCWHLNEVFNNVHHFSSHQSYVIQQFLSELKYLIDHKEHQVQIMGTTHTDAYGHTSGLIGQYDDYGFYYPALVQDSYIRFKVVINHASFKVLKALDTFSVFHYLVKPSFVEKVHLPTKYAVYVPANTPPHAMPASRYKSIKVELSAPYAQNGGAAIKHSKKNRRVKGV
jgi:hypothetical protein